MFFRVFPPVGFVEEGNFPFNFFSHSQRLTDNAEQSQVKQHVSISVEER